MIGLRVEAEAHQSWPPKKETDKLTKRERQRKKERKKTKYIVIYKIAAEKYKKLLTLFMLTFWSVIEDGEEVDHDSASIEDRNKPQARLKWITLQHKHNAQTLTAKLISRHKHLMTISNVYLVQRKALNIFKSLKIAAVALFTSQLLSQKQCQST